jgi:hypothetical protein
MPPSTSGRPGSIGRCSRGFESTSRDESSVVTGHAKGSLGTYEFEFHLNSRAYTALERTLLDEGFTRTTPQPSFMSDDRFIYTQRERRGHAQLEAALVEPVGVALALQRIARQLQPVLVGGEREVAGRHLGHQRDLRAASRLGGGKKLLRGLRTQAAHAPEQVDLVG